jgi:hypothetical protein
LKRYCWRWVYGPRVDAYGTHEKLHDVWIEPDGTLHNPHGYPRGNRPRGRLGADERKAKRLSEQAVRAAQTRRRRQELRVYQAARRIVEAGGIGQRSHCYICGKYLTDPTSIGHGIGSECWEKVLEAVTRLQTACGESRMKRERSRT